MSLLGSVIIAVVTAVVNELDKKDDQLTLAVRGAENPLSYGLQICKSNTDR